MWNLSLVTSLSALLLLPLGSAALIPGGEAAQSAPLVMETAGHTSGPGVSSPTRGKWGEEAYSASDSQKWPSSGGNRIRFFLCKYPRIPELFLSNSMLFSIPWSF